MMLGLLAYLGVAAVATAAEAADRPLLGIGLLVGVPAVMLLGAGLASAARGSRIDAAVAAVAFAIGMPVAAVTSLVIAGWILDGFAAGRLDIAGDVLRRGVTEAIQAAPAVGLAAAAWVVAIRRWGGTIPAAPSPSSVE